MEGHVEQWINPAVPAKVITPWRDSTWHLPQASIQAALVFWDVCSVWAGDGGYYRVNPVPCSMGSRGGDCHFRIFKFVAFLIVVFCRVRGG